VDLEDLEDLVDLEDLFCCIIFLFCVNLIPANNIADINGDKLKPPDIDLDFLLTIAVGGCFFNIIGLLPLKFLIGIAVFAFILFAFFTLALLDTLLIVTLALLGTLLIVTLALLGIDFVFALLDIDFVFACGLTIVVTILFYYNYNKIILE
jgi:hypothetical protein